MRYCKSCGRTYVSKKRSKCKSCGGLIIEKKLKKLPRGVCTGN